MYYNRSPRSRLSLPVKTTIQAETIPASVTGVNALTSLAGMAVSDCIYCYNLVPSEYGMRLRKGYAEYATGMTNDVRSLIPYDNQSGNSSKDRLFSVNEDGIWNTTVANTITPTLEQAFATQNDDAGFGVYTNFTTDAADHLVLYADGANGLYQYDGDAQTWSIPAITGVDPTTIAFVGVHKQRVWIIPQDSADGWYLPVDAVAGVATKFTFGSKFTHGGKLMGIWTWSVDGGDGVDDFLVAISRAGDVLVYHGSDPSQPDWQLRGAFFVGELPDSRRVVTSHGGDLYVLSTYGVTSLRDLLQGVDSSDQNVGPSAKISRFLREEVILHKDEKEWILDTYPADGFLQIATPITLHQGGGGSAVNPRQYVMNLLTSAWGWWRNVPVVSTATWRGEYFMGGPDGVLYIYDGEFDGTTIDGSNAGQPIDFSVLTSFQPYGGHSQWLRAGIIRPQGIVSDTTSVNVKAVYNYDINAIINAPPVVVGTDGYLWDDAASLWDTALWNGTATGASIPIGADGMGRTMAIGMKGSASNRVTLIAWDVLFNVGGYL